MDDTNARVGSRAFRLNWRTWTRVIDLESNPRNAKLQRFRRVLRWTALLGTCLSLGLLLSHRHNNQVAADRFFGAKFVTDFALKDANGIMHTFDEWHSFKAVVVCTLDADDSATRKSLHDLLLTFDRRGIGFYGLSPVQAVSDPKLGFPVLHDPSHELIEPVGFQVAPEAAVLDSEGLVIYKGRLEGVSSAIEATLLHKRPAGKQSAAIGTSLSTPAPIVDPGELITYVSHIAPILREHCVECHRPGQVGPFSLLTYKDVAKRAGFVSDVMASGQMPPWKAMPGWGRFFDAHHLTRRDLALIDAWVKNGAKEGEHRSDFPPLESPEWQLGPPDLILTMAEPYTIAATGDDWRGFVLPGQLVDGRAITAVEFKPGNRKVAHHARIFIDSTEYSRKLDSDCAGIGFSYDGRYDIPRPALVEWGPGMKLRMPPDGVAKPVKPGSDVVMLLHYHGSGKLETDQSCIGLYFARTPSTRIMAMHPLSSDRINIPAGEASHREIARTTLSHDVHAYSVFPHGHNLLRDMKFTATLPSGEVRRLLWINDWNFAWQTQYYYAEPIALPRGTKLEVVATYDNSSGNPLNPNSPPQRVRYGPSSNEEMLGCHLYVVADDEAGDQYYRRKWEEAK